MADEDPDLLLTVEEIQAVTNEDLDPARALAIATMATEAVRDYCGWRVAKAAVENFTGRSRSGSLVFLPTLHVNAIVEVRENGTLLTEGTDYDWDDVGVLERLGGRWATGRRAITVRMDHGYTTCPGGIQEAVAAAVARGDLAPAGGIASETAIGQSIVYSRMSAGGLVAGAMFAPDELTTLDAHRIRASR